MKKNFIALLTSFCFFFQLHAQKNIVSEGIFNYKTTIWTDSLQIDQFWFMDSLIIFEQKNDVRASINDSIFLNGYETYKYTFFDLRTFSCQDYYSFSDTASVEANYQLSSNETPGWDFYSGSGKRSLDSMYMLDDTMVQGKSYKRIRYRESQPEHKYMYYETQYWSCNDVIVPIIHIDKRLESTFPGCMLERIDMEQLCPTSIRNTTFFTLGRKYLTAQEIEIFKKWEKNAKTTKLPVLTLAQVRILPSRPLKYKDHPFFKKMYEAELEQLRLKDKPD